MKRLTRSTVLFLILYTALAQPGLPACWLMAHACEVHVHFSQEQASHPHTHEYLFDLAAGQGTQASTVQLAPALVLIKLLFSVAVWREACQPTTPGRQWMGALEPPPPR